MEDTLFVSGLWTGFYTYAELETRHRMEFHLIFKNGAVNGDGTDNVGPFVIQGSYEEAGGSVRWTKIYTGSHEVIYDGKLDGIGLYGIWKIPPQGQGTFRLWPRQVGNGEH